MSLKKSQISNLNSILYALPELGINGIEVFLRLYLLLFYTQAVNLSPQLAGLALGIATIWDAITDPLVGAWSDQFYRRKRKRDLIFIIGSILTVIALVVVFSPPHGLSQSQLFLFLLVGMMGLSTASTFFIVPYSALVGDFSLSEAERTRLIGWRLGLSNLGGLLGIALPGYFAVKDVSSPELISAIALSVLVMITVFIASYTFRDWPRMTPQEGAVYEARLRHQLKVQWNQFFQGGYLKLVISYFIANIGLTLNSSLALLYYRQTLRFSEQQVQAVLLAFFIFFSLSIPVWIFYSKNKNRLRVGGLGILFLGISNCVIYLLLPPENLVLAIVGASFVGGVLVGSYVLLESVLTETIKKNDQVSGQNSFGATFGIWKMSGKVSRGFALFLSGWVLEQTNGFDKVINQNEQVLAYYFGPGVGMFFILAALLLLKDRSLSEAQ